MDTYIDLDGISLAVVRKRIRNIHLRIYAHTGLIRISAPQRMSLDDIRSFAMSKLDWIKKHRQKMSKQPRIPPQQFIDEELHYLWGQQYRLKVIEKNAPPSVYLTTGEIHLHVRVRSTSDSRGAVMNNWYQRRMKEVLPPLISKWEPQMNVRVKKVHLQKMKTRWGSCNTRTHHIRLNTHLAKKPLICLEYVVVHELVHLLEPSHNRRFYSLMDHFMPLWRDYREILRQVPIGHPVHN